MLDKNNTPIPGLPDLYIPLPSTMCGRDVRFYTGIELDPDAHDHLFVFMENPSSGNTVGGEDSDGTLDTIAERIADIERLFSEDSGRPVKFRAVHILNILPWRGSRTLVAETSHQMWEGDFEGWESTITRNYRTAEEIIQTVSPENRFLIPAWGDAPLRVAFGGRAESDPVPSVINFLAQYDLAGVGLYPTQSDKAGHPAKWIVPRGVSAWTKVVTREDGTKEYVRAMPISLRDTRFAGGMWDALRAKILPRNA